MDRDQKAGAIKEIGEELDSATAVFAVDYRGISVTQAAELRTRLREADASFTVVKNRLAKRATDGAGVSAIDEHLVGPTALTFVRGDAVLAAKAISDFIKREGVLAYKGGLMDGTVLDPDQFSSIARLPGVDVLRGQLVGVAASPLTGIVRTLNQLISGLASQLGQVAEQGLVSGEAPADDAPGEPAPDEATQAADDAEIAEAPGTEEAGEEAAESAPPEASAPDGEQDDPDAGEPAGPDEPAVDAEPPPAPETPAESPAEDSESEDETPDEAQATGDEKEN